MRVLSFLTALVTVSSAAARSAGLSSRDTSLQVFESLYETPQGWIKLERPDPSKRLRLRIALEMPNHALFEQTLYTISTPDHPNYGKHLKREEAKALIKPRDASTATVLDWLRSSGVAEADIENDGEWINFIVSVGKAEAMMDTTFNYFIQDTDKTGGKKIRTLQYSVPRNLKSHISMIQPTTRLGQMKAQRNAPFEVIKLGEVGELSQSEAFTVASAPSSAPLNVTACNATITPDCLRALYNVGDYTASPVKGSLFGVAGYLNEYAKYAPLDAFLKKYAPYAVSQNFTYQLINGGKDTQNDAVDDDVEANLDIQVCIQRISKQEFS